MPTLNFEEIVTKISTEKGLTREEIEKKVKEKLNQLSDLISKDGAAHIVANELGVRVYETPSSTPKKVSIKELNPAFKNVELLVKVLKVNEIRNFKTSSREGRVANVLVGDDTGTCRLVVWDEKQIKELEQGCLKDGCILKVMNCYVKDNNFGGKEVHMGSQASWIIDPAGASVVNVKATNIDRKFIKDLQENDNVSVVGTIVQIFEPRFYDSCPQCNKKVAILNFVFDDGTENIRVVCFRDIVKQILEVDDLLILKDNADKFREIQRKVAGKQLTITGRVNKNTFFNRLELTANGCSETNPKELAVEIEKNK
ncbi:hypothetical protein J4223_03945 [Candidatus Woesearchaeota archaeon]|nr:hypothetical protein [Candidatus Woesearchaeota archaeon]